MKVILTGATGMVGEGVLLACLSHPDIAEVLVVGRRPCGLRHTRLKELVVPDFMDLKDVLDHLRGYDACFYCAGISSNGLNEAQYTQITFDIPLHFAETLVALEPEMVFCHVSGGHTDGSEKGKIMWARVKGRAENALMKLPFKRVYNFRPGFMKPTPGQMNIKGYYKVVSSLSPLLRMIFPMLHMKEVGLAMINSVSMGYDKQILEVMDIKVLAKQ